VADFDSNVPEYEIPPPERARARAHRTGLAFIKRRQARPTRHLFAAAMGAAASVAIHALLIGSYLWGGAGIHIRRPKDQGVGASATDSNQQPVMTLILISEPQTAQEPSDPSDLPSRGLTPEDLKVRVLSPDPYPAFDLTHAGDTATAQSAEAHDAAERAMLFGRYMGQINARIERAWLRPRTAIADGRFQCQVSITQDMRGSVTEVTLQDCNGDRLWQQSLVNAIQSASPLPAPPDPEVFSSTLNSRFESIGYTPGSPTEGFEPAVKVASTDLMQVSKTIYSQSSTTHSSTRDEASK